VVYLLSLNRFTNDNDRLIEFSLHLQIVPSSVDFILIKLVAVRRDVYRVTIDLFDNAFESVLVGIDCATNRKSFSDYGSYSFEAERRGQLELRECR